MKTFHYLALIAGIGMSATVSAQTEADIIKQPFSVSYVSGEGDSKAVAKAKAEQKFLQEFALTLPKFVRSQERILNGQYMQRVDLVTASQIKILEPNYEYAYEDNQFKVKLTAVAYVDLDELNNINQELNTNTALRSKVRDLESKYNLVLARMNQFEKKEGHHQALLKMSQGLNEQLNELTGQSNQKSLTISQSGGLWAESESIIKALEAEEDKDRAKLLEQRASENQKREIEITKQLATEYIDWFNAEHTFLTRKIIESNRRFEDKLTLVNSHHKTQNGKVVVVASLEVDPKLLSDRDLVKYKENFTRFVDGVRLNGRVDINDFSTLNTEIESIVNQSTLADEQGHFTPYINDIAKNQRCLFKFGSYPQGPYLTDGVYEQVKVQNQEANDGWMPCDLPKYLDDKSEYFVTFNGERKVIQKQFYSLNALAPYQYGTVTFEVLSYKELVKIPPPTIAALKK